MEALASNKFMRVSPSKARLVVDQIRGLHVEKALELLAFSKKRSAASIRSLLLSAIANAENNFGLDVDTLYVSKAMVDKGPSLKRIRPRARGRASRILKPTSHITLTVGPKDA